MKIASGIVFGWIIISISLVTHAQHANPDTFPATFLNEKVSLDGKLDEPFWQTAAFIDNFTQRELDFGKPASELTRVAIVYDRLSLYIGVWCYQRNVSQIRAKYMQRDFLYDEDDNFQ